MEYIHAALLLHKAGKDIKESSLKKVLEAAGVKVDDARIKALLSALEDVDIEEAITTPVASVSAPAPSEEKEEKAEKEEEEEEEDDEQAEENAAAGMSALFG